jgi:predicted pyridoxine 5'-phosphate oxidase superfamily flavin-nucleotide-binding protein
LGDRQLSRSNTLPNAFATISFTDSVKAAQSRYGSREHNQHFELSDNPRNEIGAFEKALIETRDSFYMATISENGWPYVQHRGGPAGFIQVLDARTIGFADFKGNRQYISVGNLNANARISLILMDYPNRRRLKLWGTTRIIHETEDPELLKRLEIPSYKVRVERGMLITIEAVEWNCPQHITPRYSEAEVDQVIAPVLAENKQLRELLAAQGGTT